MKRFFQVVFFVTMFSNAFSQFNERVFAQIGGTLGADITMMQGDVRGKSFSSTQINYGTILFTGRLNFLEMTNNSSLSLALQPTLSVGRAYNEIGGGSNLNFRLPLVVELNWGTASTVSTRKKRGYSVGLGVERVKYPIFNSVPVAKGTITEAISMNSTFMQPVAVMGIKFFGKHYYCREINMRASFASLNEIENDTKLTSGEVIKNYSSMGVMISFLQYINY